MKKSDVSKIVNNIVQKALKDYIPSATSSNSMTTTPLYPTILFRPNNYRLSIRFTGRSNSMLGSEVEHTKLIFWRKSNITVQVGKGEIVGIWNQGRDRQTWKVQRDSYDELELRLNEIKDDIAQRIKDVVREYAVLSNIELLGDFRWVRHEDWVKGEDYIDKLPKEFTIHDSVFKKVYNESAIEFIGGRDKPATVEIKQYIKNRVIEDFAPEIAKSLDAVAVQQKRLADEALIPLTAQIKLHLSVMQDMKDTLRDIRNAQMGERFSNHALSTSFSSHPENVEGVKPPKVSNHADSSPSTYPFHKALLFIKRRRLN